MYTKVIFDLFVLVDLEKGLSQDRSNALTEQIMRAKINNNMNLPLEDSLIFIIIIMPINKN